MTWVIRLRRHKGSYQWSTSTDRPRVWIGAFATRDEAYEAAGDAIHQQMMNTMCASMEPVGGSPPPDAIRPPEASPEREAQDPLQATTNRFRNLEGTSDDCMG